MGSLKRVSLRLRLSSYLPSTHMIIPSPINHWLQLFLKPVLQLGHGFHPERKVDTKSTLATIETVGLKCYSRHAYHSSAVEMHGDNSKCIPLLIRSDRGLTFEWLDCLVMLIDDNHLSTFQVVGAKKGPQSSLALLFPKLI